MNQDLHLQHKCEGSPAVRKRNLVYYKILYIHKMQTFVNRCLRQILHIKWQDRVTPLPPFSLSLSLDCSLCIIVIV